MFHIAKIVSRAVPFVAVVVLTACRQEPDPGITEKVDLLEAELRDRDSQIAALNSELESASRSEPAAPAAPDLDAARSAYFGFVESLQEKLAAALPDAKVAAPTMFPVDGPDMERPIISKAGYRITRADGSVGEVTIPVAASTEGVWEMPDTDKIVASFKAIPASRPKSTQQAPSAPAANSRPKPVDVMGAGRTVEVQWPDDKRPASPQKPAPRQPAQPTQPALPKKVMPTSRDVIIDFE